MSDIDVTRDTSYRSKPAWWVVQAVALLTAAGAGYAIAESSWVLAAVLLVALVVTTQVGLRMRRA